MINKPMDSCPSCGYRITSDNPPNRKVVAYLKTLSNGVAIYKMGDGHIMAKRPGDFIDNSNFLISQEDN